VRKSESDGWVQCYNLTKCFAFVMSNVAFEVMFDSGGHLKNFKFNCCKTAIFVNSS